MSRLLLTRTGSQSVFPDVDAAYERLLETFQRVRKAVATIATSRKRLEREIGQLEQEVGPLGSQDRTGMEAGQDDIANDNQVDLNTAARRLAELRRQHAALRAQEERVWAATGRLQGQINAFRAAKETITTAYTAGEEAANAVLAEATGTGAAAADTAAKPTDNA